jgi:hypothetical protein
VAIAQPWERQQGEPALWYARFERYRLLGPSRSVAAVFREEKGEDGGQPPGRWYETSARWNWQSRAEDWDSSERPKRQAQRLAALEAAQARHLEIHLLQQQKALEYLRALQPGTLTPDQALRLMEAAIAGERRALEDPAVADLQRQVEELQRRLEG